VLIRFHDRNIPRNIRKRTPVLTSDLFYAGENDYEEKGMIGIAQPEGGLRMITNDDLGTKFYAKGKFK